MNRRGSGAEDGSHRPPHTVAIGGREPKRAPRETALATSYAYARATYRTFITILYMTMGITP